MSVSVGHVLRELVAWQWFAHAAFVGYGYLVYDVVMWFKGLPDPSTAQTFLVTTVTGLAPIVLNFYMDGMKKIPAPKNED